MLMMLERVMEDAGFIVEQRHPGYVWPLPAFSLARPASSIL